MKAMIAALLMGVAGMAGAAGTEGPAFGMLGGAAQAAAAVPEVPAPAPALGGKQSCRPFLVSSAFGGAALRVSFERTCSASNEAAWAMSVEAGGQRARTLSSDHPGARAAIEARIKRMALDGMDQKEADFVVLKLAPKLRLAASADQEERLELLEEAAQRLTAFLSGPAAR